MASQLKLFFNRRVVEQISTEITRAYPTFSSSAFESRCLSGLDELELVARGWHIAEALREFLPSDFEHAADLLVRSLGPLLGGGEQNGMAPFKYLPHVLYVAKYGLDHFEAAMNAQHALTQRFTAEYSIRPYLDRYPEATLARLREWTSDPSVHVRRLVSEGTRPRLPWAPRIPRFQRDPAPVLELLELLKDDPELYVRRSVANNLNDIGKDHPELLVAVATRWLSDANAERRWLVEHALRSLVKRGHAGALRVLGFGGKPRVAIETVTIRPKRVAIGGRVRFSVVLVSKSRSPQDLLVDFAVHFKKANGRAAPKVFKLRRVALAAGARAELSGSVSLAVHTTRQPYPGRHKLELLVNGEVFPLGEFTVSAG